MPKLLIVDDEMDVLDIAKMYFKKRGIDVLTADNGTDAVRMISDESPDLVLLDFNLPDITGAEVLKKIRGELKSDTKVILVSGKEEDMVKKETEHFGILRYLHKPLTIGVLEKIVLTELTA